MRTAPTGASRSLGGVPGLDEPLELCGAHLWCPGLSQVVHEFHCDVGSAEDTGSVTSGESASSER
jgi:hypothetical protein